jgi:hypothetical protein
MLQKGDVVECGPRFEQAVISRCATSPRGISPTTRPIVGPAPAAAILNTAEWWDKRSMPQRYRLELVFKS